MKLYDEMVEAARAAAARAFERGDRYYAPSLDLQVISRKLQAIEESGWKLHSWSVIKEDERTSVRAYPLFTRRQ